MLTTDSKIICTVQFIHIFCIVAIFVICFSLTGFIIQSLHRAHQSLNNGSETSTSSQIQADQILADVPEEAVTKNPTLHLAGSKRSIAKI